MGSGPETPEGLEDSRRTAAASLRAVQDFIALSHGAAEQARTADEVERVHNAGHIAIILGFQNARILGDDLSAFDTYYKADVRVTKRTYGLRR